jgi:DNA invertase Pin-like site-specific DNA recombinase
MRQRGDRLAWADASGGFAEFERALIRERQREGIAIAKTKGVP